MNWTGCEFISLIRVAAIAGPDFGDRWHCLSWSVPGRLQMGSELMLPRTSGLPSPEAIESPMETMTNGSFVDVTDASRLTSLVERTELAPAFPRSTCMLLPAVRESSLGLGVPRDSTGNSELGVSAVGYVRTTFALFSAMLDMVGWFSPRTSTGSTARERSVLKSCEK